jgi:STIMATE family
VGILIVLLRVLTIAALKTPLANPPESIRSGNYGDPPKAMWWLKQSLIYFVGLIGMKLCVFFIFRICPWIVHVGDWALGWTEGNEVLQIIFVMLLFPVIMNAIQYYIVDSFIKNKEEEEPAGHEPVPTEDPDEETEALTAQREVSFESEIDGDDLKKTVSVEMKISPSSTNRRPKPGDDDTPSSSTESRLEHIES